MFPLFCSPLLSPLSILGKDSSLDFTDHASHSSQTSKPGEGAGLLRGEGKEEQLAAYLVSDHGKGNVPYVGQCWSLPDKTPQTHFPSTTQ